MNSDRKKITQFVAHFSLALQVIQEQFIIFFNLKETLSLKGRVME